MGSFLSYKKIASLDVGLKRIGVSVHIKGITLPKPAILRKNRKQASAEVDAFLSQNQIDILIVGCPENKDNPASLDMIKRIEFFVSLLAFSGAVYYMDESFSSKEAGESIQGVIKHKKDGKIDSLAAKIILDRWLEKYSTLSGDNDHYP